MDTVEFLKSAGPRLMDASEVSKLLGLHRNSLYRMAKANRIPYVRIAGKIKFNSGVLAAWIQQRECGH
jgi:excisionase family DNA binding protein